MTHPELDPTTDNTNAADLLTIASLRAAELEDALTDVARAGEFTGDECMNAAANLRTIVEGVCKRQVVTSS